MNHYLIFDSKTFAIIDKGEIENPDHASRLVSEKKDGQHIALFSNLKDCEAFMYKITKKRRQL